MNKNLTMKAKWKHDKKKSKQLFNLIFFLIVFPVIHQFINAIGSEHLFSQILNCSCMVKYFFPLQWVAIHKRYER